MAAKVVLASCLLTMLVNYSASTPVPSANLNKRCNPDEETSQYCQGDSFTPPINNTNAINRNGVYLGMYPNPSQTLCDLEGVVNAPFAFHGIRVELQSECLWDAREVTKSMADLQKTKAILQLAIVPDNAWWGLTEDNDCQATAIAKKIGKIRQQLGRPVWLNFAPDMNCMSPPAQSTKWADFTRRSQVLANKESLDAPTQPVEKRQEDTSLQDIFATAWQLVFKAVMAEAPDTKMIWSPAPADDVREYNQFWPKEAKPHIVGMTYEPTRTFSVKEFRVVVQPFHKKFASAERPLLLTHTAPDIKHISENQRIKFLNVITDDKVTADLPFYFGAVYHNFKGKADKRVIILPAEGDSDASAMNSKMKEWVRNAS